MLDAFVCLQQTSRVNVKKKLHPAEQSLACQTSESTPQKQN